MVRITVVLLLIVTTACVRNPATGRKQLSLVSRNQEIELGQQARKEIVQGLGLADDPALQKYVSDVGMRLVQQAGLQEAYPFSFEVVDDAAVNAFALPGGPIFVTRGILSFMGSEAELAAVLAHEIGHVADRHSAQQITRAQFTQLGIGLGAALLGGGQAGVSQLAGLGANLLLLRFGRDAERDADRLGLQYLVTSRYEPEGMAELFRMLGRVPAQGERGRLPGWLETHPDPEERLQTTQARVKELPPIDGVVEREKYLRALDGLAYGTSAREGFFQGQTFVHPVLGFRFTFPEGFQTQNLPNAVIGRTKAGDSAFVLGLSPAGTRSPQQAAEGFGAQQGVKLTNAMPRTLSGLAGLTATFQAATEQGVLEGVVSFVQLERNVYQLIAFSPAGRLAPHTAAIENAFASFAALSPEERQVPPEPQLEITPVPQPMPLTEFHEKFPSTVPVEEVARLNGVEVGAALEQGRLMKRVVTK